MKQNPIPQLGAATALVQLLSENPRLPLLDWSIADDALPLSGTCLNDGVDMGPVIAAYAEVLGGTVREIEFVSADGARMYSASVAATWRDVRVIVRGTCAASVHTVAVAA
ncbi:hypothetical protein JI76_28685 [Streptomyces anulatus]|uniref:hypothetical protein n=1 Tax=Streptomyces anulatus TaxID=1892 RepID=UPI0006DB2711|nr:hypothetical protein [Streptomyces anulatus]KPL29096.1 hypothetical protein JI76_28685 [Streptomyces anulatus]